jgi:pimeloyl-ACP methyl ester carboxylesterase
MVRPPVSAQVRFIQGSADERVPLDITENYVAAMKSHGQVIELEVLPGTTHFEMMDVPSATLTAILAAIN